MELISKQQAYDVLTEYYHHTTDTQHKALMDALSRVPTVTQDTDCISRQDAIHTIHGWLNDGIAEAIAEEKLLELPSVQQHYEELTPEEAASEIASGSIMSARYWLDAMIRLKQMGYVVCRKR